MYLGIYTRTRPCRLPCQKNVVSGLGICSRVVRPGWMKLNRSSQKSTATVPNLNFKYFRSIESLNIQMLSPPWHVSVSQRLFRLWPNRVRHRFTQSRLTFSRTELIIFYITNQTDMEINHVKIICTASSSSPSFFSMTSEIQLKSQKWWC